MSTDKEMILSHLQGGEPITDKECFDTYGIRRLAARIYDLRKDGHAIASRTIAVPKRGGKTAQVKQYFLADGPAAQQMPFSSLKTNDRFRFRGGLWEKLRGDVASKIEGPGPAVARFRQTVTVERLA